MNGDELTNISIGKLCALHASSRAVAKVAVTPLGSHFGIARLGANDRIVGFDEKVIIPNTHVSMGVYAFQRGILDHLPDHGDIERTTFLALCRKNRLQAYRHNGFWVTFNNLKELQEAEDSVGNIFT
jgi:NDP-sugar pyrophosphorylase family protein